MKTEYCATLFKDEHVQVYFYFILFDIASWFYYAFGHSP